MVDYQLILISGWDWQHRDSTLNWQLSAGTVSQLFPFKHRLGCSGGAISLGHFSNFTSPLPSLIRWPGADGITERTECQGLWLALPFPQLGEFCSTESGISWQGKFGSLKMINGGKIKTEKSTHFSNQSIIRTQF